MGNEKLTITRTAAKHALLVLFLLSNRFRRSISLIPNFELTLGFHFHFGNYRYHQQENLHQVSSLFLSENSRGKRKQIGHNLYAASYVTGLFKALEEEEASNHITQNNSNHIVRSESPLSDTNKIYHDCDDNQNHKEEVCQVSDAEALLACWSFLKRRKRFGGWNEYEERHAQNALSPNYFLTDDESGDIYFDCTDDDEDANDGAGSIGLEIVDNMLNCVITEDVNSSASFTTVQDILSASSTVYDKHRFGGINGDNDDVVKDSMSISGLMSSADGQKATESVKNIKGTATEDIDLWYTQFTSFPEEPSDSRIRRVNALKRRWEDPVYRRKWYEKRWGNKDSSKSNKNVQQSHRERKAIQRARALPSGFLGSDELTLLTEEEIAYAISSRIQSTNQRLLSRKLTLQRRQDLLAGQMEELVMSSEEGNIRDLREDEDKPMREILFTPARNILEKEQQRRSERAKILYATRLTNQMRVEENQTLDEPSSCSLSITSIKIQPGKRGPYFPPKQLTPQDAFLRIEFDIDHGIAPDIDDIRLVLEPGRMKNRKLLLRRILHNQFNLRGKCVPPIQRIREAIGDSSIHMNYYKEHELEFVTHSTIERLGLFIISLLEKTISS